MVASSEYVEKILGELSQASKANRDTPGRQGSVVVLPDAPGTEVLISGDLHGHRANFLALQKAAALDTHPQRHLVLQEVCHGGPTYPSGGCMSHKTLEDVARLKVRYPQRVHFLLGNHELSELTDYPIQKNKQILNLQFRLGMQQMYGMETDRVRQAYAEFFLSCPLAVRLPRGIFVCHSIPERVDRNEFDVSIFSREIAPADVQCHTEVFDLVWGRDYRAENAAAFAKLVGAQLLINGHEPCPEGFSVPSPFQVILDCCNRPAAYVLLPTDRPLTQDDVVKRIELLA